MSSCCSSPSPDPSPAAARPAASLDLLVLPALPEAPTAGALLAALASAAARPVVLASEATGDAVRAGYHVTEVLATTVRAVDCGGRVDTWDEVVLQVLDEQDPNARAMTGTRFAGIVRKVQRALAFSPDAPVLVEWGRPGEAARRFDLVGMDARDDGLTLRLGQHTTRCKPRDEGLSLC